MLALLYAVVILAQAAYWLFWKPGTDEMDTKVWDACLYLGGKNVL
jgi:hypothetical protein